MKRTAGAVALAALVVFAAPAPAQRISLSKAVPDHLVSDGLGRPQKVTVFGMNFENAGHSNRDEWMHWQIRRDDGAWQRCGRSTPDCDNTGWSTDMEGLEISGRFLARKGFVELRVFRGLADAGSTDPNEAAYVLPRGWSNVLRIPVVPPAAPPAPTRTATPTPTPTKKPFLVGKPGLAGPGQQAVGLAPQGASLAVPKTQVAIPGACLRGFVWREATPGDHVCVTPQERAAAAEQNRLGPSRTVK